MKYCVYALEVHGAKRKHEISFYPVLSLINKRTFVADSYPICDPFGLALRYFRSLSVLIKVLPVWYWCLCFSFPNVPTIFILAHWSYLSSSFSARPVLLGIWSFLFFFFQWCCEAWDKKLLYTIVKIFHLWALTTSAFLGFKVIPRFSGSWHTHKTLWSLFHD